MSIKYFSGGNMGVRVPLQVAAPAYRGVQAYKEGEETPSVN